MEYDTPHSLQRLIVTGGYLIPNPASIGSTGLLQWSRVWRSRSGGEEARASRKMNARKEKEERKKTKKGGSGES